MVDLDLLVYDRLLERLLLYVRLLGTQPWLDYNFNEIR